MINKIVKAITWVSGMSFIISALALDSDTYTPAIVCAISLAWLGLYVYVNRERLCR